MPFSVSDAWLDAHGVDIDAFMAALDAAGYDPFPNENGVWTFTAADENPQDGIPDFLAGLISDPISMNASQGGILG